MASATNVIAGRNYRALTAAYSATTAMPADTIAYGGTISGFTDVGYTNGGLALATNVNHNEIRVDQEFFAVQQPITDETFTMSTELAEMTAANMQRATGLGTLASVAAASGTRGHDDLSLTSVVAQTYAAWLFEIQQPDLEAFRILMYRGINTGSPNPSFTPDNPATLALEVTGLVDTGYTGYSGTGRIALIRDVIPALP